MKLSVRTVTSSDGTGADFEVGVDVAAGVKGEVAERRNSFGGPLEIFCAQRRMLESYLSGRVKISFNTLPLPGWSGAPDSGIKLSQAVCFFPVVCGRELRSRVTGSLSEPNFTLTFQPNCPIFSS